MKHMAIIGAGLMFASNATNAQQTDTRNEAILGVWSNPSGSVHVRIKECGINLFREFDRYDRNKWRGKVLVPDLDRTVSGELKPISGNTLQVHGCMFGHVACKNQKWTRVSK